MPELPEVETVVRGLQARIAGKRLLSLRLNRADLRRPVPKGLAGLVEGRRIARIERRAKYILMHFDDGGTLIAHLGMSGRLVLGDARHPAAARPHDHAVMEFEDHVELRFNDARRFGLIDYSAAAGCRASPSTRRPDMPRCAIRVPPSSKCMRMYLARRSIRAMRRPSTRPARPFGTGRRRSARLSRSDSRRLPAIRACRPRTTVSTSGNSGMGSSGCGALECRDGEKSDSEFRLPPRHPGRAYQARG